MMSEWKEVKLGDFFKVKHGFAFKGKNITNEKTLDILVTPGNFHIGGGFKFDKFKYFNADYPQEYILQKNDIVITMTDLSKETDTLGYSAKIPKSLNGEKYLHNQRVGLVQFKNDNANTDYLYWLMRTREYHGYIVGSASGTSIMHTSPTRIENYEFLIPPLPEQKAIAEVLSSLDDKIDLLHRQNKTLEQMAETLFRQWFVEEAKEDWEERPLGDILSISSSKRIFYKEYVAYGVPFYRSKEIIELSNGGVASTELFITEERFNEIDAKFGSPKEGDILVTSVGTLGISYRVGTNDKFYFKDGNLTWFSNFRELPSSIIFCWLNSSLGKEALNNISIGSTQAALTISGLRQIEIVIPPKGIVQKLNKELEDVYEKIEFNQTQIRTLEKMRDTLLPKLMSGEVKVLINE